MKYTFDELQKKIETDGGNLDLLDSTVSELPDGLTVKGFCILRGSQITCLPENLTVGDFLDINDMQISGIPKSLSVKGDIFCSSYMVNEGGAIKRKRIYEHDVVFGRFICCNRILIEFKKIIHQLGYTFYVGADETKNVVTDGDFYSICENFRSGIMDVQYKVQRINAEKYYGSYTLESRVEKKDFVVMYRTITGACRKGTEAFVEMLDWGKPYATVREMVHKTEGQFGHEKFELFFTDRAKYYETLNVRRDAYRL